MPLKRPEEEGREVKPGSGAIRRRGLPCLQAAAARAWGKTSADFAGRPLAARSCPGQAARPPLGRRTTHRGCALRSVGPCGDDRRSASGMRTFEWHRSRAGGKRSTTECCPAGRYTSVAALRFLLWMLERAAITGALVTVPRFNGRPEPLCAVYHRDLLGHITASLRGR